MDGRCGDIEIQKKHRVCYFIYFLLFYRLNGVPCFIIVDIYVGCFVRFMVNQCNVRYCLRDIIKRNFFICGFEQFFIKLFGYRLTRFNVERQCQNFPTGSIKNSARKNSIILSSCNLEN